MLYELRIYHCVPGRLPDLLKRFDTITLNIWKRHGIEQAGFWTVAIGDSNQALYYFLKWESLADREKNGPPSKPIPNGTPSAPRPRRTVRLSPVWKTTSCSRPASLQSSEVHHGDTDCTEMQHFSVSSVSLW